MKYRTHRPRCGRQLCPTGYDTTYEKAGIRTRSTGSRRDRLDPLCLVYEERCLARPGKSKLTLVPVYPRRM
jgi:hypothetical protein